MLIQPCKEVVEQVKKCKEMVDNKSGDGRGMLTAIINTVIEKDARGNYKIDTTNHKYKDASRAHKL